MFNSLSTLWKYVESHHLLASFPAKWPKGALWEAGTVHTSGEDVAYVPSMPRASQAHCRPKVNRVKTWTMLSLTEQHTQSFSVSRLFPIPKSNSSLWWQNLNPFKKSITPYYHRNTSRLIVRSHTLRAITIQGKADLLIEHLVITWLGEREPGR